MQAIADITSVNSLEIFLFRKFCEFLLPETNREKKDSRQRAWLILRYTYAMLAERLMKYSVSFHVEVYKLERGGAEIVAI